MKDHLDDVEFASALAGEELTGEAAEHLGSCVSCRLRLAEMRGWIEERRQRMERDAPDWQDQRERIAARLDGVSAPRRRRRWLRPAVAAAALIAVAVGVGIMQLPRGEDVRSDLAVEEILAEADALLADDTIPGFEVIDPGFEGLGDDSDNGVS
jgi:anti-sigma factor RsiW